MITPKSKFYHKKLEIENYDEIWSTLKDSLNKKHIEVWDYEVLTTDAFISRHFWDETHIVYDGARFFTRMIKQRLKNN